MLVKLVRRQKAEGRRQKVESFKLGRAIGSDHLPIMADLLIPNK